MSHITDERLAALADDEPTTAEAEHLAACARCASERVSQRRLLALTGATRDRLGPPLVEWETIASRLRAEGMIGSGGHNSGQFQAAVRPVREPMLELREPTPAPARSIDTPVIELAARRKTYLRYVSQAAAAVVLLAGGLYVGRTTAPAAPSLTSQPAVAAANTGSNGVRNVSLTGNGALISGQSTPSDFGANGTLPMYGSVEEAAAAMDSLQRAYQYAANFIATHDAAIAGSSTDGSEAYRARLAALDEIAATTRAALYKAPHDRVLNTYYLQTLGAREVTLRQLGTMLPSGRHLARY